MSRLTKTEKKYLAWHLRGRRLRGRDMAERYHVRIDLGYLGSVCGGGLDYRLKGMFRAMLCELSGELRSELIGNPDGWYMIGRGMYEALYGWGMPVDVEGQEGKGGAA